MAMNPAEHQPSFYNSTPLPARYWDERTEPEVIDGVWCPATICDQCGKRFPPYGVGVPSDQADRFCWGHEYEKEKELLTEIANSGVELNDPRIDWVTVQIDRRTWEALAAWRS